MPRTFEIFIELFDCLDICGTKTYHKLSQIGPSTCSQYARPVRKWKIWKTVPSLLDYTSDLKINSWWRASGKVWIHLRLLTLDRQSVSVLNKCCPCTVLRTRISDCHDLCTWTPTIFTCMLKNNAGLLSTTAYPSLPSRIHLSLESLKHYMLQMNCPNNIAFAKCIGFVCNLDVQFSATFQLSSAQMYNSLPRFQLSSGSKTPSRHDKHP